MEQGNRPSPSSEDERVREKRERQNIVRWAHRGSVTFLLGGVGVALTSLIGKPGQQPESSIQYLSFIAMAGGGFTALWSLIEIANFANNRYYPSRDLPSHSHSVVVDHIHELPQHQHKQADIIIPGPPSSEELTKLRNERMQRCMERYLVTEAYAGKLRELGLSSRAVNRLVTAGWAPYRGIPLTLSGLQLFLAFNISFDYKVNNLGPVTMAEIREKVPPITFPKVSEYYNQLTPWKQAQMEQNGYVPNPPV